MCKDCEFFVNTHYGKNLRIFHNELKKQVSQVETDISSLEARLKVVEQQNRFEENLEFQEAVNKEIEKHIQSTGCPIRFSGLVSWIRN